MSFDTLQEKILAMENPTVVGLDPLPEYIPAHLMDRHLSVNGATLEAAAGAYLDFNRELIDALYDIIPAVKPHRLVRDAGPRRRQGIERRRPITPKPGHVVHRDVKRGDIGPTAEAYSAAYLGTVTVGAKPSLPSILTPLPSTAIWAPTASGRFLESCRKF